MKSDFYHFYASLSPNETEELILYIFKGLSKFSLSFILLKIMIVNQKIGLKPDFLVIRELSGNRCYSLS
ncbi:MAG: hypothetical protein COY22_00160 [Candidatus Tagabacteria bacterium CG_4_10_14_0_2_um_filter_40_13]|nr:MAG: hypothetical protein COY22_00160 [Candidatus Tagabacteria bacterium CG_4_10_14_0_2_um_filter_40_13]